MNFFREQSAINQQTRWLYLWFGLAVIVLIFVINLIVAKYTINISKDNPLVSSGFGRMIWYSTTSLWVSAGVLVVILTNYIKVRANLRNGAQIASEMNAVDISSFNSSVGSQEHINITRLRNVVEEMSIATGILVPRIFLMQDDVSINAFAAGYSQADCVIGVTQGALDKLSRDELQALVAHEIGHILSQDMRVNMELTAVLSGLMGLVSFGWMIIRSQGKRPLNPILPKNKKNDNCFV